MTRRVLVCLALLVLAGCLPCFADPSDNPRSEKLIRVTLQCDEEFHNTPFDALAADLVTVEKRSKDSQQGGERMVFQGLPRATVSLLSDQSKGGGEVNSIVTLLPEDDGKTIHVKVENGVCYKDDIPCTIQIPLDLTRKELASRLDLLKKAKKDKHTDGLTVVLQFDESGLAVLDELRGSRAGLVIALGPQEKRPPAATVDAAVDKLARAIAAVEPRQMMVGVRDLPLLNRCLTKIEGLSLMMESQADDTPDLTKFAALRHLTLSNIRGPVDLKPLEKLTQLKALTIFSEDCENTVAIGGLTQLKFLVVLSKSTDGLGYLKHLPELQYLAAEFPPGADFSFAEKMPHLQTLCIIDLDKKHDLKPLAKLPHLQCLALSQGRERKPSKPFLAKDYQNVKEFQKARPNVEVVEYAGMCLGSFWIVASAAAAAVAAWLIRRRRGGRRLACQ